MSETKALRVALLRNWVEKGYEFPIYGVIDADALDKTGRATLVMGGHRDCSVVFEDVWLVPCSMMGTVVKNDWLSREASLASTPDAHVLRLSHAELRGCAKAREAVGAPGQNRLTSS